MTSFVKKEKRAKKMLLELKIRPNWLTSHQSHYGLYYNFILEFVSNNPKYLKKFHCQKVDSTRNGKLQRLSGRFQTLI